MPERESLNGFRPGWPETCDTCRGVGLVGGHGDQRVCPDCKGSGLPSCAACAGDPEAHDLHVCGKEPFA